MRPKLLLIPVLTGDANGICVDQTTAGAADLSLNGALVTSGVATAAAAQIVAIEGTGNSAAVTFAITGTDADNKTVTESIAGPNNGTVKTTGYFLTVTGIAVSGAVDGNVEIGWLVADGMSTKTIPLNYLQNGFAATLDFNLTAGTMTVTVQYSVDDPQIAYTNSYQTDANWQGTTGLTGITADAISNLAFPVMAVRLIQTIGSATGAAKHTVIQGAGS